MFPVDLFFYLDYAEVIGDSPSTLASFNKAVEDMLTGPPLSLSAADDIAGISSSPGSIVTTVTAYNQSVADAIADAAVAGELRLVFGSDVDTLATIPSATTLEPCLFTSCGNGTCSSERGVATCTCNTGFTGEQCEINIDDCPGAGTAGACANGATCVDEVAAYRCECAEGWMGTLCNVDIVDCAADSCANGGTCIEETAGFSCECPPAYEGGRCEEEVNECLSNPCQGGGTCIDEVGGFRCECPSKFLDELCTRTWCDNAPCQNGGTCDPLLQMCICRFGFDAATNCTTVDTAATATSESNSSMVIIIAVAGSCLLIGLVLLMLLVRYKKHHEGSQNLYGSDFKEGESPYDGTWTTSTTKDYNNAMELRTVAWGDGPAKGERKNQSLRGDASLIPVAYARPSSAGAGSGAPHSLRRSIASGSVRLVNTNGQAGMAGFVSEDPDMTHVEELVPAKESKATQVKFLEERLAESEYRAALYQDEFRQASKHKSSATFRAAGMDINRRRNRYQDILPYDDTRVVLDGREENYINASHVNMTVEDQQYWYIAAQAPTERTLEEFWTMIWQQRCELIVMLTLEDEGGRSKCHRYWPETANEDFAVGQLHIRLLRDESNAIYRLRLLEAVEREGGSGAAETSQRRKIWHLQFLDWPDHGVPGTPESFLTLMDEVRVLRYRLCNLKRPPFPTLVHCSAGVGRTGVLILLDLVLARLENGQLPEVAEVLQEIREQRGGMVQTLEQYRFCYEVALLAARQRGAGARSVSAH